MKKFKNNFGVKGSLPLLKALKEEVEKLGWKYDNDFAPWGKFPDLYFNANITDGCMKTQHFSSSSVYNCTIYNLPQQWDECLKAASELEEEIPEYVKCIQIKVDIPKIKQGHVYKVISYNSNTQHIQVIDEFGDKWDCTNINLINPNLNYCTAFTYSTKEDYEKQQKRIEMQELLEKTIKAVGFNKKLLEEEPMEIAGYSAKFKNGKVSIGCYKDITLKDLKIMKKAIKVVSKFGKDLTVTEDSIIDNTEDSAIFLDEIEQLIERLDG